MFNFSEDAEDNALTADRRGVIEAFLRAVRVLAVWLAWIEFTRNSIQAIPTKGVIKWFLAPRSDGGLNWGIVDTGHAMDGHEMVNNIGTLRRSGVAAMLLGKRHGIGARMSALRASPSGTYWTSVKNGMVSTAGLWLNDKSGDDPVRVCHEPPMTLLEHAELHPEWLIRPEILEAGHGTQVIFNDFMAAPPGFASTLTSSEKLLHMLSQRWFGPLKATIEVEAIQRGDHWCMTVIPLGDALNGAGERLESVIVAPGVTVHAWILPEDNSELKNKFDAARIFEDKKPRPGFGFMQDGEMYKFLQGGGGKTHNKLRKWGITHGAEQITLIVELDEMHFQPSDDRSRLLPIGGTAKQEEDELPEGEWGAKYAELMPAKLREHVRSRMLGSEKERYDKLREWQLSRLLPSRGTGPSPHRTTCSRCDLPYKECKCEHSERICPTCHKHLSECNCEKTPKQKKPGPDDNKGAFWPKLIDWREMPEGPSFPCQFVPIRGGELYMNSGYKNYKKLVKLLASEFYGFDLEVAERIAQQVYVSVAVDVVAGALNNRKPDPEQKQFEDTLTLPNLIACKIDDIRALHGFTTKVAVIVDTE